MTKFVGKNNKLLFTHSGKISKAGLGFVVPRNTVRLRLYFFLYCGGLNICIRFDF